MVGVCQVIAVACGVILLKLAWLALNWVWLKPKKMEKLLRELGYKGNSYKFLIGDIKESFELRRKMKEKPISFTNDYFFRIDPFQHHQNEKYGNHCFTWLGPTPIINIANPDLMRDAMLKIDEFPKPKQNPIIQTLVPGIVSYEGEKWAKHRKLLNPAFRIEKIKHMVPAFYASVSKIINTWEKMTLETGSSEIDVYPYLMNLSADAISRAAFGSSYKEGKRIFELLKEHTQLIMSVAHFTFIPGFSYLPIKTNRRINEINVTVKNFLMRIIEKRRRAMEAGEPAKDDLLGTLIESSFEDTRSTDHGTKKEQFTMSFHEMVDECKLFYFAGQETTSNLLVWTMIMLSKHQDWQARARQEVVATFGMKQPDFNGLNTHLKTVTMILYEVLRLYPPVVMRPKKVLSRETKLGDLIIPPGAALSLSIIQSHHDTSIWGDDAKEFNPGRFSEGIAKATNGSTSFFPFGWGPRICIGQNFAIAEAKMALSVILQHFSFELSPSYTHGPFNFLSLQPQYGAHVIIQRL